MSNFLESIQDEYQVPEGMALAVWRNKYSRVKEFDANPFFNSNEPESKTNKRWIPVYQTWAERVTDVVEGNFSLDPRLAHVDDGDVFDFLYGNYNAVNLVDSETRDEVREEFMRTLALAKQGVMPFAGRHLQHGDRQQRHKLGELFTNCSTAMFSWTLFFLLLKGSGVGRDYSSDICWVDWDYMPECRFVLEGPNQWGEGGHPDYVPWIESLQAARHKYDSEGEKVRWFTVDDSAEGWVKIIMILETAAFHKNNKDHIFIFDFSNVRAAGTPIVGQQNRPASGPVPLIEALTRVMTIKGAGFKPWKQALFIDDYLAACVALGGIRRAARIATKYWKDRDALEFVDIKREGFLKSANNSILVDAEFWALLKDQTNRDPWAVRARRIYAAATEAAYHDNTGEPGIINVDRLSWSDEGIDCITSGTYINPVYDNRIKIHPRTSDMIHYMLGKAKSKKYRVIVNPCSEIPLAVWGGYCIIADVCGTYARTLEDFKDACVLTAKALMRVNLMAMMYGSEVQRTNRIGVGIIGIFEFAWNHFQLTLHDILLSEFSADDERVVDAVKKDPTVYERALAFKSFLNECRAAIENACIDYAKTLGVVVPHTMLTMKPAGTTSKVLASTEAANAPANNYYLRNNQYPIDDPQYHDLKARGYPWRDISHSYAGHHIVGFPTKQQISDIMGDKTVVAADLTPETQYEWLRWLEQNWFGGNGKHGQVSFTMKYYPDRVSYHDFQKLLIDNQSTIRCCSWMQIIDMSKFPYQPEEPITKQQYENYMSTINRLAQEDYTEESVACEGGFCPIDKNQFVDLNGKTIS